MYTGEWPGTELTQLNSNGFYYYQFEASLREVNFIFNAGMDKDQTADLWTDEDVCYTWLNGAEVKLDDCKPTDVENILPATKQATKFIQEGRLVILHQGILYNAMGQVIE
jgi:hypothetical protein